MSKQGPATLSPSQVADVKPITWNDLYGLFRDAAQNESASDCSPKGIGYAFGVLTALVAKRREAARSAGGGKAITADTSVDCQCGWRRHFRELLHDGDSMPPQGCCPKCQSQFRWKPIYPEASGTAREAPSKASDTVSASSTPAAPPVQEEGGWTWLEIEGEPAPKHSPLYGKACVRIPDGHYIGGRLQSTGGAK